MNEKEIELKEDLVDHIKHCDGLFFQDNTTIKELKDGSLLIKTNGSNFRIVLVIVEVK